MNTYYDKGLSNLSYTSKDFHTIYPELLELAKKLSYKWDPTTSMESDPGVVLIKLAALMADKQNYNIDKNTLELIPKSVTQLGNARQLFDQVGYRMKYFRSAVDSARLFLSTLTAEQRSAISDKDAYVTFPQFTTITDLDSTILYTTIEAKELHTRTGYVDVDVIQGSINDYMINGEKKITAANLDYLNRLYFQETDIAENGLFISTIYNSSGAEFVVDDDWTLVDNLAVQPLQSKCYKFGISQTNDKCYIEFPSDIASLIPDGIYLKYIRSDGLNGNIGPRFLTKFYDDLSLTLHYQTETGIQTVPTSAEDATPLTLTSSENFRVNNLSNIANGLDPETIDEAYQNYEKIKNTFETLVSTTDYSNYLISSRKASNGFVCDRTDDPNASAKITYQRGESYATVSVTGQNEDNQPLLEAFDLTIYAFNYADKFDTEAAYMTSYNLQLPNTINSKMSDNNVDIKTICHNFPDLANGQICLLKNKYPIYSRIIPSYKLTEFERDSVMEAVYRALYGALNSTKTKFGQEIDYDLIYDTIMNADTRIKAITLNDIEYTTYAIIKEPDGFIERELNDDEKNLIYAKAILCDATPYYLNDPNNFKYDINQKILATYKDINAITTGAEITLVTEQTIASNTQKPYTCEAVRKNEAIYLTAPNIVQKEGGYQNCTLRTNISLPPNSEYLMQEGDWIEFYLVSGEGIKTVTVYHYRGLSDDNDPIIICVPPELGFTKKASSPLCPNDKLNETSGNTISTTIPYETYKPDGNSRADLISISGLNEIILKRMNKITIYSGAIQSKLFWLTKRQGNILFDEGETEYTLEVGEEVIYTNAGNTKVTILGEGTTIARSAKAGTPLDAWSIDASIFDYEEFFQQGIDYLNYGNNGSSFWFSGMQSVDAGWVIEAQENVFHTLYEGAKLQISDLRGLVNWTSDPNEGNIEIKLTSNRYASLDVSRDYPCLFSYVTADNSQVNLPYRCGKLVWKAKSRLYINASSEDPQQLANNQNITFDYTDDEGQQASTTLSNVWIKPNIDLPYIYGTKAATASTCMIETFELIDSTITAVANQVIKLDKNHPSITVPFCLSNSTSVEQFVLPIEIVALSNDAALSWSYQSSSPAQIATFAEEESSSSEATSESPYFYDDEPTLYAGEELADSEPDNSNSRQGEQSSLGTFSIPFEQSVDQVASIKLELLSGAGELDSQTCTIIISRPIRKILSTYMSASDHEQAIREIMDKWLTDSGLVHNDFRELDPADIIEDPLDPISLLNPAHPYNKYTICQWDTKSPQNSILVSNKVR